MRIDVSVWISFGFLRCLYTAIISSCRGEKVILGIYGHKNSGKTVLVEELIGRCSEMGYRIATIKHTRHMDQGLDVEGTDTWRHGQSGAEVIALSSDDETMFILKRNMELAGMESSIGDLEEVDLIVVEGFKGAEISKVAVGDIEEEKNTVFRFKDNLDEIVTFIKDGIGAERILQKLPGLDCKKCGLTCVELAAFISDGQKELQDCIYFSEAVDVTTKVNGKNIPMGKFAKDVLSKTLKGLVSSLKGVPEERVETIEIKVSLTEN
ncbi:MAG: molybdopterin-guanine dinucleotide biosynthesis protein B [Candidatus Thorarchaeota archaeon]